METWKSMKSINELPKNPFVYLSPIFDVKNVNWKLMQRFNLYAAEV